MKPFQIFLIPTKLKGSIYVFPGPFTHRVENFAIEQLQTASVDRVVNLTSQEEWMKTHGDKQQDLYREKGIEYTHYPIEDYGVPLDVNSFTDLVNTLHKQLTAGKHIGIHCIGGIGRSGLLTAALLNKQGFGIHKVFDYMSSYRGRNMPDTAQQISWFKEYVHSLNSE